ncbi:MAG TPA: DUF3800 domain-containing protein [Gemmobacter sp.]|nr:DUF3800 domain-containing protein [Gemmobacter sp.]
MGVRVFIDESGEPGLTNVRTSDTPGASPYFVLAAVVAQRATEVNAKSVLRAFKSKITKQSWRHATQLSHAEKVYFAREAASFNARYFAVISNKATLDEYKDAIDADPQKFYNKCSKYLIELVSAYLSSFGVGADEVSIVFEARNHDYDKLIRYLARVKENPIYPHSRVLSNVNPFSITAVEKGKEDMLEFADLAAHAVYQLTNRSAANFYIPESRYFSEMSRRFAADGMGRILGHGIKCIHSLDQLDLSDEVAEMLRHKRADPRPLRK